MWSCIWVNFSSNGNGQQVQALLFQTLAGRLGSEATGNELYRGAYEVSPTLTVSLPADSLVCLSFGHCTEWQFLRWVVFTTFRKPLKSLCLLVSVSEAILPILNFDLFLLFYSFFLVIAISL